MRVWAAGLDQRRPGQPVVVLEAGAGEGLDTWKPVFADLARVAPVVAYDRRGLGQSAPDTVKPGLRRVAQSLRALLQELKVSPPYVLVGHSWGGLLVRAFFDQYATDVAGLVFLDAFNFGMTRADAAARLPPGEREKALAPPTLPTIPPDTLPGLRAEMEAIGAEMTDDFPEARTLRLPAGIPIAVVKAAPPGRLASMSDISIGPNEMAGMALRSPKGLYIAAGHVGHMVHRDDPGLVVFVIQHVLKHAGATASQK